MPVLYCMMLHIGFPSRLFCWKIRKMFHKTASNAVFNATTVSQKMCVRSYSVYNLHCIHNVWYEPEIRRCGILKTIVTACADSS
jgi:hypothetical protein